MVDKMRDAELRGFVHEKRRDAEAQVRRFEGLVVVSFRRDKR